METNSVIARFDFILFFRYWENQEQTLQARCEFQKNILILHMTNWGNGLNM